MRRLGPQIYGIHPDSIHSGTNVVGAGGKKPGIDQSYSQKPLGEHARHSRYRKQTRQARTVPVVVFDVHAVAAFLRDVTRITVLVRRAHAEWSRPKPEDVTYRDRIFFWINSQLAGTSQPPGNLTLSLGDEATISNEVLEATKRRLQEFYQRVARSPASGMSYLEEQEKARQRAVATLDAFRAEIAGVNRELCEEVALRIAPLIVTKFFTTIIWKSLGVVANGVKAFFADVGYDVTVSVAKEWEEAGAAEAAFAASQEALSDTLEEISKKSSEETEKALEEATEDLVKNAHDETLKQCEAALRKLEQRLITPASAYLNSPAVRTLRRMHIARSLGKGLGKGLVHGVKALWLGKDFYQAGAEAMHDLNELDYVGTVRRRW